MRETYTLEQVSSQLSFGSAVAETTAERALLKHLVALSELLRKVCKGEGPYDTEIKAFLGQPKVLQQAVDDAKICITTLQDLLAEYEG